MDLYVVFRETLGSLAGLCFMVSAVPMAISCIKRKSTDAPWATIVLVTTGALLMLTYGALLSAWPLVVDMSVTFSCWLTIGIVKKRQKKSG